MPLTARLTLAVLVGLAVAGAPARAQELNCTVTINRSTLPGNEYEFLDDLQFEVQRYLNDRAWTPDVFENRERIDCNVQIILTAALSLTQFQGQIAVQSSRPIYGTAQRTPTLLLLDDAWIFNYTRGQSLVYDPNRYDPFLSVLDFYANVVLAMDYDTFEELGGTPYYEQARLIAELGRSNTTAVGWGNEAGEDRSRYTLVQEMLDPAFLPLRRAQFRYHFGVLDQFAAQPEQAWTEALATLATLHELYLNFNRRRYATDLFFSAKATELADLLRESPQRNEAYAFLSEMDAAHLSTYDALVSGR
ncbi:MAG TPA: DUF4835 family protein [Rubricoccaceae bacterium]|jgi:hypothetical protein